MTTHRIVISDGVARAVYNDDLAALAAEGTVTRANHVEPATAYGLRSGWVADMAPSGGGLLAVGPDGVYDEMPPPGTDGRDGFDGFPTRQAALDAERAWLRTHLGV